MNLFSVRIEGTVCAETIDEALLLIGSHFVNAGAYGIEEHPDDTFQADVEIKVKRKLPDAPS